MSTFATIPIDKIKLHPDNVRRDAVADEELVDSIKAQGILQSVSVVESGDVYLLIAGHRRLDGAGKAGLTAVPAMILDHLVTRGQQIEAMLVENGRRRDLTPMEEAKGYEQLTFEGYKPKDIAKATGRTVATVQSRLRLNALAEGAQDAVHSHQITLEEAEKLADLEDFPDILAKVEKTIGTPNFSATLRGVQWDVDRETKHRVTRAEFEAAGLTKIEPPEDGWNYETGPAPFHGALEDGVADAWYERDAYSGPGLAVTKVDPAGVTEEDIDRQKRESEWEQRRVERDARAEARGIARQLRIEHLHSLFAKVKLPPAVLPVIATELAAASINYSQEHLDLYAGGIPLQRKAKNHWEDDWELHAQVKALKPAALTTLLFGTVLVSAEDNLRTTFQQAENAQAALDYFDLLTSTGYNLSDTEVEHVSEIKERLVELQAEPADESGDD